MLRSSSAIYAVAFLSLASANNAWSLPMTQSVIYFADSGTGPAEASIYRADPDGSNQQQLLSDLDGATDLFVDNENGYIYWNRSWTGAHISRANLDGTDRFTFPFDAGSHFTIDPITGKLYTGTIATNKIASRNLDGSDWITLFGDVDYPLGMSLDSSAGRLYWAQTDVWNPGIFSANVDGTDRQLLIAGGIPLDVELDLTNDLMYWIDQATKSIRKASLDGTGTEIILENLNDPRYLALDLGNDRMLWSDSDGTIQSALLDGSDQFTFTTGLIGAGEIFVVSEVVPEPSTWAIMVSGFACLIASRRLRRHKTAVCSE